jgi:hypothetical protein
MFSGQLQFHGQTGQLARNGDCGIPALAAKAIAQCSG